MKIQDLILSKIPLGRQSNTGFYQVKCPCCNDYKERGGWKIEGDSVFYSCFNCPTRGGFDSSSGKLMSKTFIQILKDFGVSDRELNETRTTLLINQHENGDKVITSESLQKVSLFTPEVQLPEGVIRVDGVNCPSELSNPIAKYLEGRRLSIHDYPFFASLTNKKFARRVIIPYYRQGKIIYWQARSIDNANPRYLNCEVSKSAVLFNSDELFRNRGLPLFVCEGVFDALHLGGIGLLGSTLSDAKIELLQKTERELIFVIDQDIKGKALGQRVIREKLGSITFVPIIKGDVCDSVVQNGKIWTVYELLRGKINDETKAKLKLNFIQDNNVRYRKAKNTY